MEGYLLVSDQDIKVFGLGWGKTGTTTLGYCLEILGFSKHLGYSPKLIYKLMDNDLGSVMQAIEANNAFEDWPFPLIYKEIDQRFPNAKFILTVREGSKRGNSYKAHVGRDGGVTVKSKMRNLWRRYAKGEPNSKQQLKEIRKFIYGTEEPHLNPEKLEENCRIHNQAVINYFSDRPEKLLVVNWEQGHGWQELCSFLDLPIPNQPFPHINKKSKVA